MNKGMEKVTEVIPRQGLMFRTGVNKRIKILVPDERRRRGSISPCSPTLQRVEKQTSKNRTVHGAWTKSCADFAVGGCSFWMASIHQKRRPRGRLLHDLPQRREGISQCNDSGSRAIGMAKMVRDEAVYLRRSKVCFGDESGVLLPNGWVDKDSSGDKSRVARMGETA